MFRVSDLGSRVPGLGFRDSKLLERIGSAGSVGLATRAPGLQSSQPTRTPALPSTHSISSPLFSGLGSRVPGFLPRAACILEPHLQTAKMDGSRGFFQIGRRPGPLMPGSAAAAQALKLFLNMITTAILVVITTSRIIMILTRRGSCLDSCWHEKACRSRGWGFRA